MTEISLLDGSIGQELVKRSGNRATPLWSTQVMMDQPDLVGSVHSDYFAVGATIATTNTYALHRSRLEDVGMADEIPALIDTAMAQAEMARARYGNGRIAGSLGPLLASYRPDPNPEPIAASVKFGELVQLMKPRVDLFLIETVSSVQEATGALMATSDCGKPVWLALSVMDQDGTCLRSGEPLGDIAPLLDRVQPRGGADQLHAPGIGGGWAGYHQGLWTSFQSLCQRVHPDNGRISARRAQRRCTTGAR